MPTLGNITQIPASSSVEPTRAVAASVGGATASSAAPLPAAHRGDAAQFSTSGTYRQRQTELRDVLRRYGFAPDQADKLSQLGNLPLKQLSRAVVLSQMLSRDPAAFDDFAKILKNIQGRGRAVDEGVRVFLDAVDRALGEDSRAVTEEAASRRSEEAVLPRVYSAAGKVNAADAPPEELVREFVPPPSSGRVATEAQMADFKAEARAFAAAVEEFPERFPADAFARNALAKEGLPLNDYVRLAGEMPPLKIVNLIALARKQGVDPQVVLQALLASVENGDDLKSVFEAWEGRFTFPATDNSNESSKNTASEKTRPLFSERATSDSPQSSGQDLRPPSPEREGDSFPGMTSGRLDAGAAHTASRSNATLTMTAGEKAMLGFAALDARDGVLPDERTGFVVFPQRAAYPGPVLNLAFLPPGVYMVLCAGVNASGQLMNLWRKVVVREREEQDSHSDMFEAQSDENKKNDEQQASRRPPVEMPLTADLSGDMPQLLGRFLGEIILPLDFLSRDPGELAVLSPSSGIVVTREEFESGAFPHHAVSFRFLTHYLEPEDVWRRHAPLKLRPSLLFDAFDVALKNFSRDPVAQKGIFLSALKVFFENMMALFPAGEKTFAVARDVFEREVEGYAAGRVSGDNFDVVSLERDGGQFVSACYAKGARTLAAAGDVSGALLGMARATLTALDEGSPKAALGRYLAELRAAHFAKMAATAVSKNYADDIIAGVGSAGMAGDTGLAEIFIKALALPVT